MLQKNKLLTILMLALTSTLLIFSACEKEDEKITKEPTNKAPTCTIIIPEDGVEYTQGEKILIYVEAADEDNNLEEVQIYINEIYITTVSILPYELEWDTMEEEPGFFTIKAEAIDEEQERTIDEINITLRAGMTDNNGYVYPIVQIGDQVWMAENMRGIQVISNNSGAFYSWYKACNVCPDGWHLPSDEEWIELIEYLGGADIAGGKMKETGTLNWYSPNTGATNESGFSALPGGFYRYVSNYTGFGDFHSEGMLASFWSSTEGYPNYDVAYRIGLSYQDTKVFEDNMSKELLYSVRCVKDN